MAAKSKNVFFNRRKYQGKLFYCFTKLLEQPTHGYFKNGLDSILLVGQIRN